MKFLNFSSMKSFKESNLTSDDLISLHKKHSKDGYNHIVKAILLHRNCPLELVDHYSKDPIWYIRLVAMCNKTWWKHFFSQATSDPKSTVRKSMYLRAQEDDKFISELELNQMIKNDTRVHNYFNQSFIKSLGV